MKVNTVHLFMCPCIKRKIVPIAPVSIHQVQSPLHIYNLRKFLPNNSGVPVCCDNSHFLSKKGLSFPKGWQVVEPLSQLGIRLWLLFYSLEFVIILFSVGLTLPWSSVRTPTSFRHRPVHVRSVVDPDSRSTRLCECVMNFPDSWIRLISLYLFSSPTRGPRTLHCGSSRETPPDDTGPFVSRIVVSVTVSSVYHPVHLLRHFLEKDS